MKHFPLIAFLLLTEVTAYKRQTEFTKKYSNYINCVNRHLNQIGGGNEKFVGCYLYIVRFHESEVRMQ